MSDSYAGGPNWERNKMSTTGTAKEMVTVKDLKVNEDDRGSLFEALHNYDIMKFGQVYVVRNPARGAIRAFHKHRLLFDYFVLIAGVAKFCYVDDRNDGVKSTRPSLSFYDRPGSPPGNAQVYDRPSPGTTKEITVSGYLPKLMMVPPGVFHGWCSLTDDTILLSIGSEVYDARGPDEFRVPPNYFNQEFGRDPWTVVGR